MNLILKKITVLTVPIQNFKKLGLIILLIHRLLWESVFVQGMDITMIVICNVKNVTLVVKNVKMVH